MLGSNSFSGASFAAYALKNGAQVIGISRSAEVGLPFAPYKWTEHKHFEFYQLDLNTELNQIATLIQDSKPEFVVNFAGQGMVAESWEKPEDWFQTNVVATIKLHNILRTYRFLKKYVHISTPEVYGNCTGSITEQAPFHPSTPYAVSRAAADMSLQTFYCAYGFPVVTTRAANVYGPGQQLYRIIPKTILSIERGRRLPLQGGGTSRRSFIHIRDVCDATWRIMLHGKVGDTYHISTSGLVSIRGLVELICKQMGASFEEVTESAPERLGNDSAYDLDCSKLRETLGWTHSIDLVEGIGECISWVRSNYESFKDAPLSYAHKAS